MLGYTIRLDWCLKEAMLVGCLPVGNHWLVSPNRSGWCKLWWVWRLKITRTSFAGSLSTNCILPGPMVSLLGWIVLSIRWFGGLGSLNPKPTWKYRVWMVGRVPVSYFQVESIHSFRSFSGNGGSHAWNGVIVPRETDCFHGLPCSELLHK